MNFTKFQKTTGIHITTRHTGKMSGMLSLSTSALCNKYCAARRNDPDSICSKCFAVATMNRYTDTEKCMARNTETLTTQIIPVNDWPLVNARIFRLESFGDIANETQIRNYFNFAARNPKTTFSLWTKNPGIIARAIADGYKKPRNFIIIYSSPFIDSPVDVEKYREQFPFIDKFFTVYRPETIKAENIKINCGARSCVDCGRRYSKKTTRIINEKLK